MIKNRTLFAAMMLTATYMFGFCLDDVVFKRVTSGQLREEEELFIASFVYAYRNVPQSILKTDSIEKRLRPFFAEERADVHNPEKEVYFIRAEHKGKLVGFVSFEPYGDECVYIRELSLDPSVMKCGLGKKFVFMCKEYLPATKKIVLATTFYNENALEFYKHLGFTQSSEIPHNLSKELFIGLEYVFQ